MATKTPAAWRFDRDRQHWTMHNAADQGFPLKGEWRIKFGASKPRLESPIHCWLAEKAPSMDLEIAYTGIATTMKIFWKRFDDDHWDSQKSLSLDLTSDGKFHAYHLDLASSPAYRDLIIGVAIEQVAEPRSGRKWSSSRWRFRRLGRNCVLF